MFLAETQIRVRYAETDQMGYVYYGNYPQYYEVGRVEAMRQLGMPYKKLEENGIMLPVSHLNVKYIRPAHYDDLLTIKTTIKKIPEVRIEFEYEIYNEKDVLLNIGTTTLVFVDLNSGRPTKAPQEMIDSIKKFF
ncbi:MAG: acyl-CoA thioester hydrolase [Patiriisocius sp.]|jgi:acyl-CoA thioester hydrolase